MFQIVIAIELGLDSSIVEDELKLRAALLGKDLDHHLIKLLSVHGFENLILHVTS